MSNSNVNRASKDPHLQRPNTKHKFHERNFSLFRQISVSENVVHAEMESICDDCVCDAQPLLKATSDGHGVCALEEMELGADVNERDSYQYTALINAASQGLNKCVKELLNAGADVNARGH